MLADLDYFAVEYLALNMRPQDREEVLGLMDHDNPLQLAAEVTHQIRNKGRGRIAWHRGRPAALMAFVEIRSGVWEVYMFGTEYFKSVAFELARWCRKEANDILTHCKGHRLQATSRADYHEAHKLIRALGGIAEGSPLRRYGKDGKDYQVFTWLNGENDAVLKPHYVPEKETA
jgi:hypothetical protein